MPARLNSLIVGAVNLQRLGQGEPPGQEKRGTEQQLVAETDAPCVNAPCVARLPPSCNPEVRGPG
eukprot:8877256-Lingulodinium_polyedra.AAC.1